jgi:hypothetical protein
MTPNISPCCAAASLADPAPSLSEAEADARLAALFAAAGVGNAAL